MQNDRPSDRPLVLLVEDETPLRSIAAEMLEDAGTAVVEADTADAAWHILETRTDVDILFTDINMPGSMDGVALAQRVRERWPQIALVITSGRYLLSKTEIPSKGQFLPKPYRYDEIVGAMQMAASRH